VLAVGTILGGKLQLERLASSGGMGEVFQGRDLSSGQPVAVKVLRLQHVDQLVRFEREARMLAELDHPNIVRYIDHAVGPLGQPYIVMEWLDGEDLAARLRRKPLTLRETLSVGRDVAEAMAAAHARGIIHRDLKPGNVFLVRGVFLARGEFGQSKVLDFGIARLADWTALTQTGVTIGTLGYMAPEQARSRDDLTPAADVFSLGCLLFECLTGKPVFAGEHPMAVLDKSLFETAPQLRADVPAELEALIKQMLAYDPEQRPRDGAATKAMLAALPAAEQAKLPRPSRTPMPSLTRGEQRLLSVVLIARAPAPEGVPAAAEAAQALDGLRHAAARHGGHLEVMADGAVMVALTGTHVATDQAALSARCALSLRAEASDRPMALAMGRSDGAAQVAAGAAVERAASELARRRRAAPHGERRDQDSGAPPPIALDDVTAGLLDGRFEVREAEAGFTLHGEREVTTGTRRVLGRATSCVGRDRELANLARIFADGAEEAAAQAVLVTAPAGMGKSRLTAELLTLIKERHEAAVVWIGRGDPLRGGSAFGLLRQALQGALGLHDGDPLAARQATLRTRVARHVPPAERQRVTEFLGELLSTPFPDGDSAPLRAARHEAAVMSEQMRRAAEDFLRAECAAHPVLLVLEDLHWGDLPTVRFIDAALRNLKEQPWMVLALARPEVHKLFPQLWSERGVQEVRLRELTRAASERLVRQVLGEVDPDTMARLVTQAEGNPFYLEELIRAVAERRGEALPETVVAMVHARLGRLPDDERRLLRAASVFGEVFWSGGVAALLGGALPSSAIHTLLEALVERELLVRRPDSRFTGLPELSFRHALLREGAYAMLTEDDRTLGHRLAAEWLEHQGESDPLVLAEHYDRGQEPARAARYYARSAERAVHASDMETAVERARRALAHGLPDAERVVLLGLLAEVHVWRSEWEAAVRWGTEAMRLAAPGTDSWARAVAAKLSAAMQEGQSDDFFELMYTLLAVEPAPEAIVGVAATLNLGISLLNRWGRFELVERSLQRVHAIVEPLAAHEPMARGWMHMSHVHLDAWAHEDPWAGLQRAEASRAGFREANHRQCMLLAQLLVGMNLWYLGALEQAERELRDLAEVWASYGTNVPVHLFCFAGTLADRGALEEAHEMASRTLAAWQAQGLRMYEGQGRRVLADVLFRRGEHAAAEREARAALPLMTSLPLDQAAATATIAAALLGQGRAAEALAAAGDAMTRYEALGAFGFRGGFARLVHVEALEATGDHAGAARALATMRKRLRIRAARIDDLALRRSFLEDVPEHARTLALARRRLGDRDDGHVA
jgi:tetratricopeptide (TPR) repeat protein